MNRTTNELRNGLAMAIGKALCLLTVIALLAAPVPSNAQASGTGSIAGTVTDPSGAVVAGASITAVNTLTGVKTTTTTTASGHFVISLLQPGTYSVIVAAPSFATLTQQNVVVDALAVVGVSPKLSLGAASQTVVVTEAPPTLDTEDVKLGSSVDNETYDALPLAMNQSARDPTAFIGLAVGVNNFSVQPAGPTTASFNGGQTYQNETYVEGLPVTSAGTESDTRNLAFGVSVEAVDQFQVAVTGSDASFEGQGVSNFIVKAGTDKFHGGVYEYFRNTIFDAAGFFANVVPIEHQNEFGASLSGPVIKDKLFFFINYDGYRFDSAFPPTPTTIPTLAERMGDFSAFPNPIYDPTTCLTTNSSGACTSRKQISCNGVLNVICPGSPALSKVAQSFQSYLPTKNYDGTPLGTGISANYLASLPNLVTNDNGTAKLDYDISSRNRLYGLFSRGKYANPVTGSLSGPALPVPYTDGRGVIEYSTTAQVHDDYVLTPRLVNNFGYGLSRLFIPLTSNTASGNYPSKAGLTGLPPGIASTGFPDISFSGNNSPDSWDGTNSHAFNEWQTTFTAQDNVLWTKGRNQFTFGYQWQALQDNENTPLTGTQAGFSFSASQTANFTSSGAIDNSTGLGYASFLLGAVSSSTVVQNAVIETGGRYKTNALYVQDDVQVSPSLTLNMGLRWDLWSPFNEVLDRMSFFNPDIANPVAGGIKGGLQFAGDGPDSCHCHTPVKMHYHNFGPRFGLAYKIDNKTVVRASYAMVYAHAGGVGGRTAGRQGLSQIGFNSNGSLSSTVTGQPAYYWDSGVPGNPINPPFFNPSFGIGFISASAPGAAAIGAGPGTAQTLVYGDPDKGGQAPQYQNFFLNIQRAFGANTTLSVAYSGSVGRYLPGAAVNGPFTNQIPLQYLPLGSLLTQTLSSSTITAAKALGFTVAAPFPNFTGTVGQSLKPFPQYNGLSDPWLDVGKSSYNALQTTLNRRITNGLTFMINYTFSKEMDDLAGARLPGANYLEYSVGGLDHKHVLHATAVYKLPFGEGRRFNGGNPVVRAIVDDWQLSGIFTVQSGSPLSVGANCTTGGILGSCYPNLKPGFSGSIYLLGKPGTRAEAALHHLQGLNVAFTNPDPYTYGNAARSAPYGLFAPAVADIDLSVRREIPIVESVKLAIQADAFNVPNSVYFNAVGTSLNSASYGTYTSQNNQARKLQFSARLTF
ncbi:MAG TPA: TonB-dependent receptor [Acidobacteriaceae bacterium]|nr:TonB-dependent receptor [Acidobacteriaceae bacterium]